MEEKLDIIILSLLQVCKKMLNQLKVLKMPGFIPITQFILQKITQAGDQFYINIQNIIIILNQVKHISVSQNIHSEEKLKIIIGSSVPMSGNNTNQLVYNTHIQVWQLLMQMIDLYNIMMPQINLLKKI